MRAILFLLLLNLRGTARRIGRQLRNPRYLVLWIVLGALGLWALVTIFSARQYFDARNLVGAFVPLMMLGIVLASFSNPRAQRHLFFSSAEVVFLFPGPFSPRHLLLFKLVQAAIASAPAAFIMAIWFWFLPGGYVGAFFAIWLAFIYLTAIGMGIRFFWELSGARGIRPVVIAVGIAFLAIGIWQAAAALSLDAIMEEAREGSITRVASMIHDTWLGMVLLKPFEPFGYLFASGSAREFVRWSVVCLSLYTVVTTLLFLVNFDFRDVSLRSSARLEKQLEKARRGDFGSNLPTGSRPRCSLPDFPSMGGAGALLWRQLLVGIRGFRGMLMTFLFPIGIFCGVLYFMGDFSADFGQGFIWMMIAWMTLFLSGTAVTCDFRGDITHLDSIKALPISPSAVVIGQVLPPTLLTWFAQVIALAAFSVLGLVNPVHALLALVVLAPFNFLLFEAENLAVLLFPIHPSKSGAGEISARGIIVFMIKGLIVGIACLVSAALAWVVVYFSGSIAVGVLTASATLAGIGIAGVSTLANAFSRFDLSHDTPPQEG